MTDLTVRVATPDDVPVWCALRYDGICRYPGAFIVTPDEAVAIPVEVDARRLAGGGKFLAFEGADAVGLAALNPNGISRARHRAEIGPFYVVDQARGRGVADALMEAMCASAVARGIWQLELYVNIDNPRAIAFYARHGFVEMGRVPNAILGAAGPETDALMIRTMSQT
ncbi:GNAT family N-acetyltransferase [uncultured Tateyamaria sp.]|uniref:GNAT family N-acetyltransferase n=1 Tax=uncultured Tateyamaria sp. TaxID=455651 RepID=UPI0026215C55|nr:GNAT family N-acetyltransferase [uncultured Tateyamaria sp.]